MTFTKAEQIQIKSKREYGIDALRMLSMFMVVVLHMLGNGGILDNAEFLSVNFSAVWFMETLAFCAVNCYGLISGYVGFGSKYRISGIVTLWLQVVFYTVGITVLFYFIKPEWVDFERIKMAVFPVMTYQYWYFSAYFGLFFLMPILNTAVENLKKRQIECVLISVVFLFCVLRMGFERDVFSTGDGYSLLWLGVLYLLGAYFKKYQSLKRFSAKVWVMIYILCAVISWSFKLIALKFEFNIDSELLIKYVSPTMLFAAIGLFGAFLNAQPKGKLKMVISKISPLTFSVYIIHVHPFVWRVMTYKLTFLVGLPVYKLVLGVILVSAGVFFVSIVIDSVRVYLFNTLKIKKRIMKIEDKFREE